MQQLDPSLLSGVPAFAGTSRAQLDAILKHATSRRYESGEAMFNGGEPAAHFFLLLDGHVRVLRSNADGEEVIVLHIPSGELLGIAQAVGRDTYPATAVSAGESIALSWPAKFWETCLAEYPSFASVAARTVGVRIEEMNSRIMELATQQVEQRIACALLRMAQQAGKTSAEGITISFPITRQNIADMTGSTLHTVSRLLSGWEREGILSSARRKITICQPEKLVRIAGQGPMANMLRERGL